MNLRNNYAEWKLLVKKDYVQYNSTYIILLNSLFPTYFLVTYFVQEFNLKLRNIVDSDIRC
jgi:hypothetical protein